MAINQQAVAPEIERSTQIMSEMVRAAETLTNLGLAVSVFGSARIKPSSSYYAQSQALGRRLAEAGLAVIAGGGPGIMEAANKGAFEAGGHSVGLHIKVAQEAQANQYLSSQLDFDHFLSRKSTFFQFSVAYIVLPGGFGTLDELFECLTLVQTRRIAPCPIILVGKAFWGGLVDWLRDQLLANGLVDACDPDLFTVEDDLDAVMVQINHHIQKKGLEV
ncbi:hypothetical protein BCM14_2229 [Jezberella montanilacus]|jgi:uncharacterized protein (TIGR00730 family)|uniref:Cytokinin riboside 5'-monophosphate phosphoribohydrolase n=2 Tax=Jezberella montanilacus TaxID=323426 RepID=A0A2T0XDY5_9BURK|nr:TIGR00730 family Rossman fold protein [Jezberella montanilacus]PRY97090.1 hypothetical protein BCM14_2229 [Jezberella montanilacus]